MMFSFVECTYPIKLPFTLKVKCRNKIATTYMNIHSSHVCILYIHFTQERLVMDNYLNHIYEMF